MNIVQTYYSYTKGQNPIHDTAGFLTADMNWKSMALSCLLLKKHYGKVTLYCNQSVRRLVLDDLKIPYDEVIEMPDFMKNYEGCNLWALPKIYTYSLQIEPFIHVDCDWFMFEKLAPSIIHSDVIGQNIEYDDQFYNRRTLEKLISNGCSVYPWVMDEYNSQSILRVVNAGILGGNDIDFIQSYVKVIKDFVSQNMTVLQKMNDGFVNSIYEQLFFYLLAKRENKTIGLCTVGDKLSTKFDWIPMDVTYSPKVGYMHLLANLKRRFNSYVFVSNYLDYIDSSLNYRISKLCYDNGITPLTNYPQWDIYSSDKDSYNSKNESECTFLDSELQNAKQVIRCMENELYQFPKQIYCEQKKNVTPLWEIASLWDTVYSFTIYPKIVFSEISRNAALATLSGDPDKIQRLSASCKKIYLVLIPDASRMKVLKCIITGIRGDILEFLSVKGSVTLNEISTYLSSRLGVSFESDETKMKLDRTIRSMVVGNILKFESI